MSKLIALRIPDDLLERIKATAAEEDMNVSQTIIYMLRDGPAKLARERESEKPIPKPTPAKTPGHHPRCGCTICKPTGK